MRIFLSLLSSLLLPLCTALHLEAADAAPRPDQLEFRELFRELVETNTTLSAGSCTLAAERMAAHLRAAGFPEQDLHLFADPAHPKEGGLVAVLPGQGGTLRPLLLLAHLDVVEARREDWVRDPFVLVEEDGYFYARGVLDDKAMAATWVDLLARLRQQDERPARTLKMALTCGEETMTAFNGAEWLARNRRELIDAEFALNEGGGGDTDGKGRVIGQSVQVGEKAAQNFRVETVNPGGHSSIPVRDNAIYQLADALVKVRAHAFPVHLNDTTRAFFARAGAARADAMGRAMVAIANNPGDKSAETIVNTDRSLHSMLRTTCVATLLEAGHASNALPQRATANVNCRIVPGETVETTEAALAAAIADPDVRITRLPPVRPLARPPPLDPAILAPMQRVAERYFPGIEVVPTMATGYTDAIHLGAVDIPVYGVPGIWTDPDGNGAHGLDERLEVRSLYVGRDYLTDLVKIYAGLE